MSRRKLSAPETLKLQLKGSELAGGVWTTEHRFHPVRRWRFDFAWPDVRVALEINGGAFLKTGGAHTRGAGYRRDLEKRLAAAELGWLVLDVLPEQVHSGRALQALEKVLELRAP